MKKEIEDFNNLQDDSNDLEDADIDLNMLYQSFDTSWGRSSTPLVHQKSVKFTLDGRYVVAMYCAIIRFGTEREMIDMKHRYRDDSINVINAHVAAVKKRYKNLSKSTIKLSDVGTSDSLEIISAACYNPTKTAYFRRKTLFEII